jgi:hypothetical protein
VTIGLAQLGDPDTNQQFFVRPHNLLDKDPKIGIMARILDERAVVIGPYLRVQ